jgi:hypothetical protein
MTIRIRNLTSDDNGKWSWTLMDDEESTCMQMRTNNHGEGIWALTPGNSWTVDADGKRLPNYDWHQQTGTGQFSLYVCSDSAARGRILHVLSDLLVSKR